MSREERIHWIENAAFENGGEVSDLQVPITLIGDNTDFVKSVSMYSGDSLRVHLQMKNISVPISGLTDSGVEELFNAVCL